MNKKAVDRLIPMAQEVLKEVKIVENSKILNTYRGQVSTFGAAIINGSLISAVAFFSNDGNASVERKKIIEAIRLLIPEAKKYNNLFEYVKKKGKNNEKAVKEEILNAAIALKLAMNLFELEKKVTS